MSKRALNRLIGGVVALVVLYLLATALSSRGSDDGGAPAQALEAALETAAEASRYRIREGDEVIELELGPDGWLVNGDAADSSEVEAFHSALREARIRQLASTNPSNHPRLGVDEEEARVLEVPAKGSAGPTEGFQLLIGETGSPYPSYYLRLERHDEVFLVHGSLRAEVMKDLDRWRMKEEEEDSG